MKKKEVERKDGTKRERAELINKAKERKKESQLSKASENIVQRWILNCTENMNLNSESSQSIISSLSTN